MKCLVGIIFLSSLFGCRQSNKMDFHLSVAKGVDSGETSCPYLARDSRGNIVLSYTRKINDTASVVCFAVSNDKGKSFAAPVIIPASTNVHPHAENMPKIICKPSGEMIAAWGAGNPDPRNLYAGMVFYAQSFDQGKTWTAAHAMVSDTAGFDQRYFDMALLSDGEVAIIWLDNRTSKNKPGSGIYFAKTNGINGFEGERRIAESCCECCRTDLMVDEQKNIHLAYRGIVNDSIRDVVHIFSADNGKTFTSPQRLSNDNWVINGCPHTGPSMAANSRGLHVAWYTMGGGSGLYFSSSDDNGRSFSPRHTVCNKSVARHPQLLAFENGDMAIVWDESRQSNNQAYTTLGFQKRSASGKLLSTVYLPQDTLRATFPVINLLEHSTALLAYNRGSEVVYRRVSF